MDDALLLYAQDVAKQLDQRAIAFIRCRRVVRHLGYLDFLQIPFILNLGVKIPRQNATPGILGDDLGLLVDAKSGVVYDEGRVEGRFYDHIGRHVGPLVDGPTQLSLHAPAKWMVGLEFEFAVHVHLVPGDLVDPYQRPARLVAVQARPLGALFLVHR